MTESLERYNLEYKMKMKNSNPPMDSISPLKTLMFSWVSPLIKIGSKLSLDFSMMPDIPKEFYYENYSNKIKAHFTKMHKNMIKTSKSGDKFMILKLICSCFKFDMIICVTFSVLYCIFQYSISYMIQCILEIPEYYDRSEYRKMFIIYGVMLLIFKLIQFVSNGYIQYKINVLGIKTFFSLSSLTLDKTMKMSFNQNSQYNIGEIINLGTVDSQKFSDITNYFLYIFTIPITLGIGFYYLYKLMGISMVIGMSAIMIMMIINIFVVRKGVRFTRKFMEVRGERIKKTNEIFNNIKYIKTACLEEYFGNKIIEIRNRELEWLRKDFYRTIFTYTNSFISPGMLMIGMFVTYILLGNKLTVAKIFTSISIFKTFQPSLLLLPNLVASFIDILVSSQRLSNFLLVEDIKKPENCYNENDIYDLIIRNGNFFYKKPKVYEVTPDNKGSIRGLKSDKLDNTSPNKNIQDLNQPLLNEELSNNYISSSFYLKNINIEVKKGELIAIIGKSGSGKTSLMLSILGELHYESKNDFLFSCNPNIAYISQKAWIRNDTLKENILFGNEYDSQQYENAIKFSGLEEDIRNFIDRDNIVIGDKGVNLSGGQKIRVSIARAIYSNKNVILMDDPLSALDIDVGNFVFQKCIKEFLKDKTRIVITHNIALLKSFDKILIMDKGQVVKFGNFKEVKDLNQFKELMHILNETTLIKDNNKIIINNNVDVKLLECKTIKVLDKNEIKDNMDNKREIKTAMRNINEEVTEDNKVTFGLINSYMRLASKWKIIIELISIIMIMFLNCYLYIFYKDQGNLSSDKFNQSYFFKMFIVLQLGIIIANFFRNVFNFSFCIEVSKKLNTIIIFRMLHASLNNFYHKTPIGKVLNRLSGDMQKVDMVIPYNFSFIAHLVSIIIVNLVMIAFSSNIIIFVFIIIYIIIVLYLQRYFSIASIQQSKLDSVSKSPFFSLFGDSVNGITDIRAFKKENFIDYNMKNVINLHVKTSFVLSAMQQWLALRISLCSFIFVAPSMAYIVIFNDDYFDYAGVLLTAIMEVLNFIALFLTTLSSVENNFVAFDRCRTYMNLEYESGYCGLNKEEDELYKGKNKFEFHSQNILKANWPKNGSISFDNFSAKYSKDSDYVLNNINLKIREGEKIGIIGRTGAGKTSLVMSLVRFFEHIEGSIKIDGADISSIDLKYLRSSITYISQDSYFFEGTLRNNIDPHHRKSDKELIELLKEAEMIDKLTLNGGLDWKIQENGSNISYGEKQIFCFIRAIVDLKKIIIMDEATSNLDIKSESILEGMKRKYFENHTTLTIAHRLNTIYQSDKILILEKGRVKCFSPINELKGNDLQYFEKYIKLMEEGIEL